MTDEDKKVITDFEAYVRQLLFYTRQQEEKVKELSMTIQNLEKTLTKQQSDFEELQTAYKNLKIAKMMKISDDDVRNAKSRIAKLVREIDKCIALLNI